MHRMLRLVASATIAMAVASGTARAQGYGASSGSLYTGGGTTYVPYGASMGGFLPYTSGPGGGLGVQSRMTPAPSRSPILGGSMGGGMGTALGRPRSSIAPLRPISATSMGGGGLIRRASPTTPAMGGGMSGGVRPAVGSYPFRQPPSLVVPNSGPATSM